ncbi:AraC family transcriptional regulator [Catenuloplanes indicus]|uniref:AraC-like DNA-binding protein n=1 Tax=Catenuloplanes indicus TaxID=137267 RepID=A0AAE3VX12_9ACTN|nr:helix-turn-helix transcriptional regulator [Catenuloplanes indicus]MDQ0365255.1 AraC-like DNA-binding protein [Catenuloplanes indicus]
MPEPVRRSSFSSNDDGEIIEFIRRTYADNRSRFAPIRDGARFSALTHDVPALGADRVRTSIDYAGTSAEGFQDYVFFVVHAGSVQIGSRAGGTVATRGDVSFYPLRVPIEFSMRGFDVTTLRLPADRIQRAAEDTAGVPAAAVRFHGVTPVSAPMRRYWHSLIASAAGALMDHPASPLSSPLLAEDLARTVATAALHVFPNTTLDQHRTPGPGDVAPAAIRRAVAHIDANAHLPIQLSEIAAAAGISARALQYGFRRHLDMTPLEYLRRVRLDLARRDLQRADPARGATVRAIAVRWGFGNTGRFAADYRAAYGVLPGETLRS